MDLRIEKTRQSIVNAFIALRSGKPVSYTHLDVYKRQVLYDEDAAKTIRKSHENPAIKELYETYLGKPGSEKAHHLLHTTYVKRKINEVDVYKRQNTAFSSRISPSRTIRR